MSTPKQNYLERFIAIVAPGLALKRAQATAAIRAYDSALPQLSSEWTGAGSTSQNTENRFAHRILRDRARAMVRNSPHAQKALKVLTNNAVGTGIMAKVHSDNPRQQEAIQARWKAWAETTAIDFSGQMNFYAMQALALQSAIEAGDVIARKRVTADGISIQLLESDYIDANQDDLDSKIQGIQLDPSSDKIIGYWLFPRHPGEYQGFGYTSSLVPANEVSLIRRIDRPGQIRGVSHFHGVLETINSFNDLQRVALIKQKIAACFTAFVTSPESDATSLMDPAALKAQRVADSALEPGVIKYLKAGEKMEFATPPGTEGYAEFSKVTLRSIAAGLGITYEALTGDYSQVNFSSGRMGALEFNRHIDALRWTVIIPQFCDFAFKAFLQSCAIQGIDTAGVSVEWCPPARTMIDPSAETAATKEQLRLGLTTLPRAIAEQGYDYQDTIQEIARSNADLDALGIVLDGDARKLSQQGIVQTVDPLKVSQVTEHNLSKSNTPAKQD